eukprot:2306441-Prymnesium_polylepis.1
MKFEAKARGATRCARRDGRAAERMCHNSEWVPRACFRPAPTAVTGALPLRDARSSSSRASASAARAPKVPA